ncbi:hypothetical protein C7475_1011560 [Chitinophaga sp. S165]|nr:hypothetical protein C7475_1011560 [Chitinophaga sp. S165]
MLILAHCPAILGQARLLQTDSQWHPYYVELNEQEGVVYPVTTFYDKGASGYYMQKKDTLQKQPDNSYAGRNSKIVREEGKLYLLYKSGKTKKYLLNTVTDTLLANEKMNNAYYQRYYAAMSTEVNETYPLGHHSFRNAFYTWTVVPEKQMNHRQFELWADKRIKEVKDSISASHDQHTRLTNYITQNIRSITYATLKDSMAQLSTADGIYFVTTIDTIAMKQPEYFFRLAEDLPNTRSAIFSTGIYSRRVYAAVKDVKGHDEVKKEFLKERKYNRRMTFTALGIVTFTAGLITWALIALT